MPQLGNSVCDKIAHNNLIKKGTGKAHSRTWTTLALIPVGDVTIGVLV